VQLNKESRDAWVSLVPTIFEQSKKSGGDTKLPQEFVFMFDKHGEDTTIVCPAGTKVFFPSKRTPMSSTLSNVRSAGCCVIYCHDVHITVIITAKSVNISYTRIKHSVLV